MQHLLIECAVRAALIALGTAAVLRLLRVRSAGARHAAWTGVVALMLLLPAWMAWGPRASWRVLPAAPAPVIAATPILLSWPTPLAHVPHFPADPPTHWNWLAVIYLSGVLVLLARLAFGTLRAQALARRAKLRDGRLTSARCAAPITVGCLSPRIILPESWRRWPGSQLDAVLAHESEHVRRRDPLVQWLALLNRAIFWFHPLAWWLERRLSALAEEACDAAVLERGHDPRDYSGYLLELARSVELSGARVNLVGMAMPGSSLPRRIRRILTNGPAPHVTRGRAICLAAGCAMLSAVFAGASVDRRWADQAPLPPPPPAQVAAPAPAAVPTSVMAPAHEFPPPPPPAQAAKPAPAALPAPAAGASVDRRSADQTPLPPLPPAQVANPAPAPMAPPPQTNDGKRFVVLYFDLYGPSAALPAATHFIRNNSFLQPTDVVAIVTSGDQVRVVEDFTADRDKLIDDIQQLTFSGGEGVNIGRSLDGLLTASKMLGSLAEEKMLVYFMPPAFHRSLSEEQIQSLIDAAQRANVAFFGMPVSADLIRAGDVLSIDASVTPEAGPHSTKYIEPAFDHPFTVGPDGMISVPGLGDIKAAGLTPRQLQTAILGRLVARVKTPLITVHSVTIQNRDK